MKRLQALLILIAAAVACYSQVHGQDEKPACRIIYVPTEQVVVEKMLDMAKIKKDDLVFDLGCGDGRIVVTAAKKYGCKGVGVDIDPARIKDSLETMRKAERHKDQVDIRQGDALKVKDLEKARSSCSTCCRSSWRSWSRNEESPEARH